MGLIIFLLILILLMPIGFIWLNYHELTSCKANAYDELARINKKIEALIDVNIQLFPVA